MISKRCRLNAPWPCMASFFTWSHIWNKTVYSTFSNLFAIFFFKFGWFWSETIETRPGIKFRISQFWKEEIKKSRFNCFIYFHTVCFIILYPSRFLLEIRVIIKILKNPWHQSILLTQEPICKILATFAQLLGVVEKLSFF